MSCDGDRLRLRISTNADSPSLGRHQTHLSNSSALTTNQPSELVRHIYELRKAIAEEEELEGTVRQFRQLQQQQRGSSGGKDALEQQAREHDIDFGILNDLKAAFQTSTSAHPSGGRDDAVDGIPEDTFIRVFGGAIGGFTSEEVLRAWCRKMDSRCVGVLSWKDLSTYLVKSATSNAWLTRHTDDRRGGTGSALLGASNTSGMSSSPSFGGVGSNKSFSGAFAVSGDDDVLDWQRDLSDRQLEGRSVQSKAHNHCINHLLTLPAVDSIISASNDGSLRRWDHMTLEGADKPMHVSNEWITGLVKVNGLNRVGVLHADRSIFFYNLHIPTKSSLANMGSGGERHSSSMGSSSTPVVVEYYRGFAQPSVFIQTLTQPVMGQQALGASASKKRAPGEAPNRPPQPVTLISPKVSPATALCHIQSTPVVETVMLGNGDGSLEMIGLRIGQTYESIIPSTFELPRVHRGRIAQVTYAPELQSAITAGAKDGVVVVTNLEHLVSTQSMYSEIDHRQAKAIQQFDYHAGYHHMLVHGYGRNIFVWNALTGMRNHSVTDIDRVVLQCALNPARHRLYALTDDKTIKVFDVRTWKCIDSVSDEKTLRVPVDHFEAMVFNDTTSMVVTGATNLVAWRTDEAQRHLEDNQTLQKRRRSDDARGAALARLTRSNASPQATAAAAPPAVLLFQHLAHQKQLLSVDAENTVQVWSSVSMRRLIKWKWPYPSSIMCVAVAHQGRQVIVGSDDGSLRAVSMGTGALCWSLDHPCGHGAGFEVSACYLAFHAPVPNGKLLFAAVSRHIVTWIFNEDTVVNPASNCKSISSWRTLHLPVDHGIIHSFCSTGPGGLGYLAATNSGNVVAFNLHVQLVYVIPPPDQIAAELLHRMSAKVTMATFSDGKAILVRADVAAFEARHPPFQAAWREGHTVTAVDSLLCSTGPTQRRTDDGATYLLAVGDSCGHLSLFAVGDAGRASGSKRASAHVRPLWSWLAHDDAPITGLHFVGCAQQQRDSSSQILEVLPSFSGGSPAKQSPISLVSSSADGRIVEWEIRWKAAHHEDGIASTTPLIAAAPTAARKVLSRVVFESHPIEPPKDDRDGGRCADTPNSTRLTSARNGETIHFAPELDVGELHSSSDDDDEDEENSGVFDRHRDIPACDETVAEEVSPKLSCRAAGSPATAMRKQSSTSAAVLASDLSITDVAYHASFGGTSKLPVLPPIPSVTRTLTLTLPGQSPKSQRCVVSDDDDDDESDTSQRLSPLAKLPSLHAGTSPQTLGRSNTTTTNRLMASSFTSQPSASFSIAAEANNGVLVNVEPKHAFHRHAQAAGNPTRSIGLADSGSRVVTRSLRYGRDASPAGWASNPAAKAEDGEDRQHPLSKRFLTFSNLLVASDRAILFEGTPERVNRVSPRVDSPPQTSSPSLQHETSTSSPLQRRGSSFARKGSFSSLAAPPQTSSVRAQANGNSAPPSPTNSNTKKRFCTRYGGSGPVDLSGGLMGSSSPQASFYSNGPYHQKSDAYAQMVSELQRPLSRVSALRRIHGRDDEEDPPVCPSDDEAHVSSHNKGQTDVRESDSPVLVGGVNSPTHATARPSQSVERRLASVHRRREEREEAEFVQGFQPYFGRVALQLFDGEKPHEAD